MYNGPDSRLTGVDPPFMESDPPHWAARGLAYVLIALVVLVGGASMVIAVPETVSGRFVLMPVRGADPLRAPRKGIAAVVRATEGQTVARDESLFVIRSEPAGDRFAEFRTLEGRLRSADERQSNARRQYESQRLADEDQQRTLRGRLTSLARTEELKRKELDLAAALAANYKKGLATHAISTMEYSRPQLDADRLAVEVAETEGQRDETMVGIEKLRHEMDAHRIEYLELQRTLANDAQEARIRMAALDQEQGTTAGGNVAILAPCAGTVLRLRIKSAGAVIAEGEILGEIACTADRLRAELTVPEAGLSLVRLGQGVKLLYDAFPYQRYGARYGVVRWIGPGGAVAGDSSGFRALVDVDEPAISVAGQSRPLLVGMGGRADIAVGRRTLISYAFEPIRQLRENMAAVPRK